MIRTILLNALPAAGKSEIRTFLRHLGPEVCREEFHLGEFVQLDDYPYIHFMRRIDEELTSVGYRGLFFELPDRGFVSGRDWLTLIHLINEDYHNLFAPPAPPSDFEGSSWLFARIDRARMEAGLVNNLRDLPAAAIEHLHKALDQECTDFMRKYWEKFPASMKGKTVIIEFSRGGCRGATFPLQGMNGYLPSYRRLSAEILARAAVLYVEITPEASRAKNRLRGLEVDPTSGLDGVWIMTSLTHCFPDRVMWNSYGCDDIRYLTKNSALPGKIAVEAHGKTFGLPVAIFHNAANDLTSFTHKPVDEWTAAEQSELKAELQRVFALLKSQGADQSP